MVWDFLRQRLETGDPRRWKAMNRRAGDMLGPQDPDRAIACYLLANAFDRALALIAMRLADLSAALVDGAVLLRWLEVVPEQWLMTSPLVLARGMMSARFRHRFDLYERWLKIVPPPALDTVEGAFAECDAADGCGDAERMRRAAKAGLRLAMKAADGSSSST